MKRIEIHSNDQFPDLSVYFLKNQQQIEPANIHMQDGRFILLLIREGEVQLQMHSEQVQGYTASLILISANTFCRIIKAGNNFNIGVISFKNPSHHYHELLQLSFLMLSVRGGYSILVLKNDDALTLYFLFKLLENNIKIQSEYLRHQQEIIKFGCGILVMLLKHLYGRYGYNRLGKKPLLALRFFSMLRDCVEKQRHVQFYGKVLHVSPDYLSKTIKELTGKSATYFIHRALLKEALLRMENHQTIAEIGESLGFKHPNSFSRFFKKYTSMPPSAYRKRLKAQNLK